MVACFNPVPVEEWQRSRAAAVGWSPSVTVSLGGRFPIKLGAILWPALLPPEGEAG